MNSNGPDRTRVVRPARLRVRMRPRSGHMPERCRVRLVAALWAVLAICTGGVGCYHQQLLNPADSSLPRELEKVSLPPYVIEPPDLLTIDALRLVPLPPYHVEPSDALFI